ncbi:MAG: OmpA family protein [Legionellales bacterium]|nr:OmpA family protein [Legionellales bacterium]
MVIDDSEKEKKEKRKQKRKADSMKIVAINSATWVVTFADLMSLLMGFFVMLFALSEVDKEKFRLLGISMKEAFGSPVSISLEPTNEQPPAGKEDTKNPPLPTAIPKEEVRIPVYTTQIPNELAPQTQKDMRAIKTLLNNEIKAKRVQVEQKGRIIVIRLLDAGAFPSGSAELTDEFRPVISELGEQLKNIEGKIVISGFTDNVPIKNQLYRSNWELSASRAYSVVKEFIESSGMDAERLEIRGHGDTQNLAPNDTPENRAKNRRVEIMIDQRPEIMPEKEERYEVRTPADVPSIIR